MNWIDIAILVVTAIAAFLGLMLGLVRLAVAVVGVGVGLGLASRFHEQLAPLFSRFLDDEDQARVAAFIAIFLAVLILTAIVSFLLRRLLATLSLGWLDRLGGLALGVLMAFVSLSVLLNLVNSLPILGLEAAIEDSSLGPFLVDNYDIVLKAVRLVPRDFGD